MFYNRDQLKACSAPLRALLYEQDSVEQVNREAKELDMILTKVIRLSKEEKQGFVYISAMYDMLFYQQQFGDPMKGLQYGEMLLRDGQELMDATMGTTSAPNAMQANYLLALNVLGELYIEYYQVNAQKLETFFGLYWEAVRGIGKEVYYWQCRLQAALQNNDLPNATQCLSRFEGLRKQSNACYVCESQMVQKYHLLAGNFATAMEMTEDFIAGRTQQQNQGKFPRCETCNAHAQYSLLFEYCLATNQTAFLLQIAPLYEEVASSDESDDFIAVGLLLRALYDNFTEQEFAAACAVQLLSARATPWVKMQNYLCQSIYFERLHQSGVEAIALQTEVTLPIPPIEGERYRTSELAAYFQTQADKIGAAFDKSRPGFDYPKRRKMYRDLLSVKLTAQHKEGR